MATSYPEDERIRALIREALAEVLPSTKVGADVGMVLTPVFPPLASVPESTRFMMQRDYIVTFNLAGGAVNTLPINIDEPSIVYGFTAAGRVPATGAELFLGNVEYQARSGNERYNSDPCLLSALCGPNGGTPRLFAGRGWQWFDKSNITVQLTNLQAAVTIRVDIAFHALILR